MIYDKSWPALRHVCASLCFMIIMIIMILIIIITIMIINIWKL